MDTATNTEGVQCRGQGQTARAEAPTEAEGDLGNTDSTSADSSSPGACAIQPRHRQQVAWLRYRQAPRTRCSSGESRRTSRDSHAEENPAAGPIRDHRANTGCSCGMATGDMRTELGSWAMPTRSPIWPSSPGSATLSASTKPLILWASRTSPTSHGRSLRSLRVRR